jgi:hypothetical protein
MVKPLPEGEIFSAEGDWKRRLVLDHRESCENRHEHQRID